MRLFRFLTLIKAAHRETRHQLENYPVMCQGMSYQEVFEVTRRGVFKDADAAPLSSVRRQIKALEMRDRLTDDQRRELDGLYAQLKHIGA